MKLMIATQYSPWNMKLLFALGFSFFLCSPTFAQKNLSDTDVLGTWTAHIPPSRAKSMDMLFEGSAFTLLPDHSFSGKLMKEVTGKWELKEGALLLDSEEFPEPMILSELNKDSCAWYIEKVNARIPFFKEKEDQDTGFRSPAEVPSYIQIDTRTLVGEWINTQVEDPLKGKQQNDFLFGGPTLNDRLFLDESGHFFMPSSGIRLRTDDSSEGTWTVDEGILTLSYKTGEEERFGITNFSPDSLVLMDLEARELPMVGQTKIRFYYTKDLAEDLQKYRIHPIVKDTLDANRLRVALKLPKDFKEFYDIEGRTVSTFLFYRCSWCGDLKTAVESEKKEVLNSGEFIRYVGPQTENMIMYESRVRITHNIWYELSYMFSYGGEVYVFDVSSFLKENVELLWESIKEMEILKDS